VTRRICTKVIWREVKVMFRYEAFMFFQTWLTWHVHGSPTLYRLSKVVVDQSSFRQKQGGVLGCPIVVQLRAPHHWIFLMIGAQTRFCAGEVELCSASWKGYVDAASPDWCRAIVSAYTLRNGAANPRFWSPYLLDRPGHFSPSGLGCTYP